MQFKHPELLYALFLLLIPIIVHLFQLRKFQKVDFTNVAFLKEATLQTRKSSRIKKWLILCTRLLLLAALILAFAQPFISKTETFNVPKETVVYLDNSFSMQAKGNQGELLKRAIQDIVSNIPENENFTIFTNNLVYKNTTIGAIKNELLKIDYTSNTLTNAAALIKSKTLFSQTNDVLKNLVFISDFQEDGTNLKPVSDTNTTSHFVKLNAVNTNNIAIDSAYIIETTPTVITLKVRLKNSGDKIENLPIALYNGDELIAKTSIAISDTSETSFSLPVNQVINGKISIDDNSLKFDNTLYFNINKTPNTKILAINNADDSFLRRLYNKDEFNYTATSEKQLNYNTIDEQHLIILNELESIPVALVSSLKEYVTQGGALVLIPSEETNIISYNQLLNNYGGSYSDVNKNQKSITTINYSHQLYNSGVFEKQVKNFQYPKANSFYEFNSNRFNAVLQFEDGKQFLGNHNNIFVFSAPLNQNNSSFRNSPLIVPTFYNIAKSSFKTPSLYYTIGKDNTFEVETQMQQDAVLSLKKDDINIIPRQQYFNSKVKISTSEEPSEAGTYAILNKNEILKNVSFNFSRRESSLSYKDLSQFENISISHSISNIFDTIKSETKVNALWKWFVIFALALLIIEMLILKFFK
ncbi:BatA domain-containing protein [uncultured Algibacter sp.]|uniref:BatA domain-containing protein n=1 Tax=uncultured Algibacter sp. TaxID=298659 RepID=UPI00262C5D8A|nr:BatA domain-containing protein [uncultured Algibacter sp.]